MEEIFACDGWNDGYRLSGRLFAERLVPVASWWKDLRPRLFGLAVRKKKMQPLYGGQQTNQDEKARGQRRASNGVVDI